MSSLRSLPWLVSSIVLAAACGGGVITLQSDGGTTGTTSSAAGGTSSSGGSGGAAATCPKDPPQEGTPCDSGAQGVACIYPEVTGECCAPLTMCCQDGSWRHQHYDCYPLCSLTSTTLPADGTACCLQADPPACEILACGSAGTFSDYGCNAQTGKWEVTTAPCPSCGGAVCKDGEVCVETGGGAGISYHCEANPCPNGQPLDCTCAGKLCPASPFTCSVAGGMVHCDCTTCP